MRLLVTGGAGYIGSVCSALLLDHGHEVVIVDNLSQGHRAAVPDGATFVDVDLLDADAVGGVFDSHRELDGIVHFASRTLVGESTESRWPT